MLKHFAHNEQQDQIFVVDLFSSNSFSTNISNAAAENHFNTLSDEYDEELDPLAIESFYQEAIESPAAPILQDIVDTQELPNNQVPEEIFALMAAAFVRVPRMINAQNDFNAQIMKKAMWYMARDDGMFEEIQRTHPNVNREVLKQLIDEDLLEIKIDQNYLLSTAVSLIGKVLEILPQRNWGLAKSTEDHKLILSGAPLSCTWSTPTRGPYSPALGILNTTVIFPLCPQLCLLGTFEPIDSSITIPQGDVANINTRTASCSTRFLYASGLDFQLELPESEIGNWEDYAKLIAKHQKK